MVVAGWLAGTATGALRYHRASYRMAETATYIYCLVERAARPVMSRVPPGLPGATRPELLEISRNLRAVVADVPLDLYGQDRLDEQLRDLSWVANIAVAHESVVEHFSRGKGSTVVPMKLFSIFSSRERALADFRSRRRDLHAIVRRIRGCDEWGVRIMRTPGMVGARRASPVVRSGGTAFLAAKKQTRDDARQAALKGGQVAEETFQALSRKAKFTHRRDMGAAAASPPLLDAAFLVTVKAKGRFRAAVRQLARECSKAGATLTLTGPWPAYNFVQSSGERE
jgi:hypothetical protein